MIQFVKTKILDKNRFCLNSLIGKLAIESLKNILIVQICIVNVVICHKNGFSKKNSFYLVHHRKHKYLQKSLLKILQILKLFYIQKSVFRNQSISKPYGCQQLIHFALFEVKKSRSVLSDSLRPHGLYSPWNSPGQNSGMGSLSLLQGIFPTQGSNGGLPHCGQILYQLSHKGSPLLALGMFYFLQLILIK